MHCHIYYSILKHSDEFIISWILPSLAPTQMQEFTDWTACIYLLREEKQKFANSWKGVVTSQKLGLLKHGNNSYCVGGGWVYSICLLHELITYCATTWIERVCLYMLGKPSWGTKILCFCLESTNYNYWPVYV